VAVVTGTVTGTPLHETTNASTYDYTTGSLTAGRLYLLFASGAFVTMTPTATGTTFTELVAGGFGYSASTRIVYGWWFVAASSGVLTITISQTGGTGINAVCVEAGNADTTTPVVQTVTDNGTGTDMTDFNSVIAAYGHADNRGFLWVDHKAAENLTVGTGWSMLDTGSHATPNAGTGQMISTGGTTTPAATWTTSVQYGAIFTEIAAAGDALQYHRPASDVTVTGWTRTSVGGSLASAIDDDPTDDADYISATGV
jgi:hypothetical protein